MSFLTGKSKSESKNVAYPWLQGQQGMASQIISDANAGNNEIFGFLQGNNPAGFEQYKRSSGYDNIFNESMRGVTSNAAARGLLGSGATLRATQDRAGQLAQQNYANYLQQLMGANQQRMQSGLGLAGLITQGGQTSQSSQREGLLSAISGVAQGAGAAAAGGAFSDIRLKENIVKIGEEPDGLGIYSFNYIWDDEPQVGVMAQEVAELRPHALGPVIEGFMTVYYGKL